MADSAVIRYSDETAPMLDTIVEVAIGADDEVKEEEEDDGMSLDSEYDEGPLDGKVMQIYLPDVAPMAAASQDEDTEAVQILKLDNYESEEDEDGEDNEVVENGGCDDSVDVINSDYMSEQPRVIIWPAEADDERCSFEAAQRSERGSVIVQPPPPCPEEQEDSTDGLEEAEEVGRESRGVLQILEIVTGEHGGVQQITVLANNTGENGGGGGSHHQSVLSDQIRQLLNSWDDGEPSIEGHNSSSSTGGALAAGKESSAMLKILKLQVVAAAGDSNRDEATSIANDNDDLELGAPSQPLQPSKAATLISRQSYTKKEISKSVEHVAEGCKSRGTQASSWTKMAEERLKVARHKLIRPRAAHASSQKSSGNDVDPARQEEESAAVSPDFPSDISVLLIFEDQRLRSFGTQVSYRFF